MYTTPVRTLVTEHMSICVLTHIAFVQLPAKVQKVVPFIDRSLDPYVCSVTLSPRLVS